MTLKEVAGLIYGILVNKFGEVFICSTWGHSSGRGLQRSQATIDPWIPPNHIFKTSQTPTRHKTWHFGISLHHDIGKTREDKRATNDQPTAGQKIIG